MDQLNQSTIRLSAAHLAQIISIAKQRAPNEACGIIAGEGSTGKQFYEISNSLNSPTEYLMDPEETVRVFWEMENNNLDTVAFFHSHPAGPPFPSPTDLERNYYPDTPYLIIGLEENIWTVRAFFLSKVSFREIQVLVT